LESGEVVPSSLPATQKAFAKKWTNREATNSSSPITIISALAVSPAAARFTYAEKRDFWDEHVYKPGLADHKKNKGIRRLWVVEESD
jgi:hypothetical protein